MLSKKIVFDLNSLKELFFYYLEDPLVRGPEIQSSRIELLQKLKVTAHPLRLKGNYLSTSGYTSGVKRRYWWGPNFAAFADFFEWLKFRHIPHAPCVFFLWPEFSRRDIISNKFEWHGDKIFYHCFFYAREEQSYIQIIQRIQETTDHHGGGVPVFWITPSRFELMFDHLSFFSGSYFYFTGEPFLERHRKVCGDNNITPFDGMRCWDGGATFITCEYGNKHWIDILSKVETSPTGELVSTDFFNYIDKHIAYKNGDLAQTCRTGEICACGLPVDEIQISPRDAQITIGEKTIDYKPLREALEDASRNVDLGPVQFVFHGSKKLVIHAPFLDQLPKDFRSSLSTRCPLLRGGNLSSVVLERQPYDDPTWNKPPAIAKIDL